MFRSGNQIGAYILLEKLGKGGFGEVWLAEKRSQFVTKRVAVKLPHDDQVDLEAIKQEATLWEQASGHPNVLPIIDADIYDDQVVIVSEYAEGGSLAGKLRSKGKLPVEESVEMTNGILKGLSFLHSKQIIHRDIKPQNILLQGNTPRLADFGISRVINNSNISSVVIGTDAYMSPEAFDGKRDVQTDIWSVGVLLYELLTGTLPFPQEHPTERMFAVLTKDFEPLPNEIPPDLRKIVQRALFKKTEERFQSAEEMRRELQKILSYMQHPTIAPKKAFDDSIKTNSATEETSPQIERESNEIKTELKTEVFSGGPTTESKTGVFSGSQSTESEIKKPVQTSDELIPPTVLQSQFTSSNIPPTEVQIDNTASDKPEKSNSLYLYLAGIFAVLFIVAIIGSGGLFLYFSNGFGTKNPVNIANPSGGSEQENLVVINISGDKLLLNDTEISEDEIVDKFKKRISDKPPAEKIIYVSAGDETIYKKIIEVLEFGRKADIDDFGLMLSNEKVSDSVKVRFPSSGSTKNNLDFPISNAFQEIVEQPKLKPLLLLITIEDNGDLKLNDTSISGERLGSNLRSVFKNREDNLVFKEGTNEFEKTIFIEASPSIRYGKVIEIIRIVEKAEASPIILQTDDN